MKFFNISFKFKEFDIKIKPLKYPKSILVKITGILDPGNAKKKDLFGTLQKLVENDYLWIVLDLEETQFSSISIGFLCAILEMLDEKGGSIFILKASKREKLSFELLGIAGLFNFYATDEALNVALEKTTSLK